MNSVVITHNFLNPPEPKAAWSCNVLHVSGVYQFGSGTNNI